MNIRQRLDQAFLPDQENIAVRAPLVDAFNDELQRCHQFRNRHQNTQGWPEFGEYRELDHFILLSNKDIRKLTQLLQSYVDFGAAIDRINQESLLADAAAPLFIDYSQLLNEALVFSTPGGNNNEVRPRFSKKPTRKRELFEDEIPDAVAIMSKAARALHDPNNSQYSHELKNTIRQHQQRFLSDKTRLNANRLRKKKKILLAATILSGVSTIITEFALIAVSMLAIAPPALMITISIMLVFAASILLFASLNRGASFALNHGNKIPMDNRERKHLGALGNFAGLFNHRDKKHRADVAVAVRPPAKARLGV